MTETRSPVRQGDVPLWPIPDFDPTGMTELVRGPLGIALKHSAVTGHTHALRGAARAWRDSAGVVRIHCAEQCQLVHEEHVPAIAVAAGAWLMTSHAEHVPGEPAREVQD